MERGAAQDRLRGVLSPSLRSGEVRMLVLMLLVSSGAALLAAAVPMSDQAPVRLNAFLGASGLVLAAVSWCSSWRGWRQVGILTLIAGTCSLIASAATPAGAVGAAVTLLWVPIYAAFFFSRWVVRLCVALAAGCFAAALLVNPFLGAAHVWLLIVLTMAAAAEAISTLVGRLHDQATRDPLTGLLNRQGLERAADRVLLAASRSGDDVAVVVVDLDGFKLVNDRQGHAAGDRLLVDLADAWTAALRADELVARHGGDEFVLLLPGADRAAATGVMQRLDAVSSTPWSYGVASHTPTAGLAALLLEADADLYAAKAARAERLPAQRVPAEADVAVA